MPETIARIILIVVGGYSLIGVLFAAAFVTIGVGKVDRAALGTPWSFRLLIFPGAAALWPVMLAKWARGAGRTPRDRPRARSLLRRHLVMWVVLGPIMAAVLFVALRARPSLPPRAATPPNADPGPETSR